LICFLSNTPEEMPQNQGRGKYRIPWPETPRNPNVAKTSFFRKARDSLSPSWQDSHSHLHLLRPAICWSAAHCRYTHKYLIPAESVDVHFFNRQRCEDAVTTWEPLTANAITEYSHSNWVFYYTAKQYLATIWQRLIFWCSWSWAWGVNSIFVCI
jgi:hypothetical protein